MVHPSVASIPIHRFSSSARRPPRTVRTRTGGRPVFGHRNAGTGPNGPGGRLRRGRGTKRGIVSPGSRADNF